MKIDFVFFRGLLQLSFYSFHFLSLTEYSRNHHQLLFSLREAFLFSAQRFLSCHHHHHHYTVLAKIVYLHIIIPLCRIHSQALVVRLSTIDRTLKPKFTYIFIFIIVPSITYCLVYFTDVADNPRFFSFFVSLLMYL